MKISKQSVIFNSKESNIMFWK